MPPSIFNLRTASGLPVCLSGLTRHHHLSLSKQFADHDRRRDEVKRAREKSSQTRIMLPVAENREIDEVSEIEIEIETEIEFVLGSFDVKMFNRGDDARSSPRYSPCTAKAA